MSRMVYFSEWAGRVSMARGFRRSFPRMKEIAFQYDPPPPENYTPEHVEFLLKLVAHWEGGPHPEDPAAVPVKLKLEDDESDESA